MDAVRANPKDMLELAHNLWPINRSITGIGFKHSLDIIEDYVGLKSKRIKFKSGKKVFDWRIPKVWNISNAYFVDEDGKKHCEFTKNNLHVMGYSAPINRSVSRKELEGHLFSLPDQKDAVPYVTSYYNLNWGFCISHRDRERLRGENFDVFIESNFENGDLEIAEWVLNGDQKETVFLSTYLCHPSMANNELSGPVVMAEIIKKMAEFKERRFTYKFVMLPETIGSIAYLSKNYKNLRRRVIGGFNLTCVGDDRDYSYLPTRAGDLFIDQVGKHVLKNKAKSYTHYSWLDRGSDERQYCSPGIDLPIISMMRSKYGTYPEYHTSLDKLGTVVTASGLQGGFDIHMEAISIIENNHYYKANVLCEPNLGTRGLYPRTSIKGNYSEKVLNIRNILSYCDGTKNTLEISEITKIKFNDLVLLLLELEEKKLIRKIGRKSPKNQVNSQIFK